VIRALVAVDEPIVEIGLMFVLDEADDIEATRFDPTVGDLPTAVAKNDPDVLILDVVYRKADRTLVPTLTERHPKLAVLVFVDHPANECDIRLLLAAGGRAKLAPEALARVDDCCLTSLRQSAMGCVAAGSKPVAVLSAVRAVARGEVVAAPWLTVVAESLAGGPDKHGHSPISEREIEVMALLAKGLSNKLIAENMGIREQTVKNHVGHLMEKLGVTSRLEAGILAAEHHLELVDETQL